LKWKGFLPLSAEENVTPRSQVAKASQDRSLKVGLILPDTEREMGGATARWSDLEQMARMAEDLGFDSIWNADHLIYRFPEKEEQGPWECWSLLAALAAVTSRVEIGPLVSCTSFRNPALLAKIADTVDEISSGRLVLGLGAGWHEPEYLAFDYPFDHRVSRFAEAIAIIHGLLRTGNVDFDGTYYRAQDCELRPRGPRPQGPPIMIGSTAPRMLGLLAIYGDIWNAWARQSLAELADDRRKVDAALEEVGRDPATVERTVSLLVDLPTATGRPSEEIPGFKPREPEELAAHLASYADAGISHVQLMLDPNTPAGIEWAARSVEALDG
jgi:alkanesulfonate monooxygenase SsuD/methylene tetrahydromethanopterin reductase-like flavin-dependent oxidoreductase (luciferase family)